VSPSAGPPLRFFLDRSLGAVVVPTALREAGFAVETMRDRYGERRAQRILDVEWLAYVGPTGMVVLMKDKRIRTRPAERQAVLRHAVRCLGVASGNMTGEAMAAAFVARRSRILRACESPGPFVYQVHARG
jgi:hypothetical protein